MFPHTTHERLDVASPGRAHWLDLPAQQASVRAARRGVEKRLGAWRVPVESCADAALLVSELAANAVLHTLSARILCGIGLTTDGFLRIEVHDDDPAVRCLSRGRPGPDEESGRGLLIVEAIADGWGVERSTRTLGHAVWATLRTAC